MKLYSTLDKRMEREEKSMKLYPKSDQNEIGQSNILEQSPLKTADFSCKEIEHRRNYNDSKMHMYF